MNNALAEDDLKLSLKLSSVVSNSQKDRDVDETAFW